VKVCIFDIKRFAVHDGPGIRVTVFFKGCPLSCWWCHNPEGISPEPSEYPETTELDGVQIMRTVQIGRWVDIDELVPEILRDRVFMEESGGGVTFSGGEPLMQAGALYKLLDRFAGSGIHTTVDTSGYAAPKVMQNVCSKTDLILFDLKSMDDARHKKFTGVSNRQILKNLEIALKSSAQTVVRITLVPGFVREVGMDPELMQPDGLHPTAEGHRRLAAEQLRAVLEHGIAVAQVVPLGGQRGQHHLPGLGLHRPHRLGGRRHRDETDAAAQ